jgi:CTP synthase
MINKINERKKEIAVAVVGKYVKLHDAYLSIIESLNHAGFHTGSKVEIKWVESDYVTEQNVSEKLGDVNAVIIPGGFGDRGIEGKIAACRYARENNIPYLGICLGMQISVIEFARNVCCLQDANSSEFNAETPYPVINLMEDQLGITRKGGTMRLGAYPCKIQKGTKLLELYGEELISERHRHRYEFNNEYRDIVTKNGMVISGTSPNNALVEAVELPDNTYFIGVQYHPEFKSRPNRPHPLFVGLLKAALERGIS